VSKGDKKVVRRRIEKEVLVNLSKQVLENF